MSGQQQHTSSAISRGEKILETVVSNDIGDILSAESGELTDFAEESTEGGEDLPFDASSVVWTQFGESQLEVNLSAMAQMWQEESDDGG